MEHMPVSTPSPLPPGPTHTTSMMTAVPLLIASTSACVTSSARLSCMAAVGSTMLMHDRNSSELVAWLATALKLCTLNRAPPNRKQQPGCRRGHSRHASTLKKLQSHLQTCAAASHTDCPACAAQLVQQAGIQTAAQLTQHEQQVGQYAAQE